jgi:hypothetical protein
LAFARRLQKLLYLYSRGFSYFLGKEIYMKISYPILKGLFGAVHRSVSFCLPLLFAIAVIFSGCGSATDETSDQVLIPDTEEKPIVTPLLTTLYVSPAGGSNSNTGGHGAPLKTVQYALSRVAAAYSGSWPGKGMDGVTPGTIVLLDPLTAEAGITISGAGKYPPLILSAQPPNETGNITLTTEFGAPLLTVGQGVTLTLTNIVLKGKGSNTAPLVKVDGGHLILEDGALITGNTNGDSPFYGGGVAVYGGTFTMSAGTISNNVASTNALGYGGGVYVGGGTFTMSGGIITNNATGSGGEGGGVFVNSGGTFIKKPAADPSTSGIIYGDSNHIRGDDNSTDNTALGQGNAVYSINGNKKRDNTAGENDEIDTTDGTGLL